MMVARMLLATATVLALALAARDADTRPLPGAVPRRGDAFELAHPAVRAFSDREGLPQNTVHTIERDARGYLWIGTQDGAARFNGRAWTVFDMPGRQVSNYVRTIVAARDGSVWFGREDGGAVRLRSGAYTVYGREAGLPAGRVNRLIEAHDGTIWAATPAGAARFAGNRFVPVNEGLDDLRLWVVREVLDDAGERRIVVGGEGGLAVLHGGRWHALDVGPGGAGSVNSIVQTAGPGPRTLWVGTYGAGVFGATGLRGTRFHRLARFGPEQGLTSRLVTCLTLTRAHGGEQVWASTRDGGLFRLEGERFVGVPLGASITEIYWLRAGGDDDPGALWVGTRTAGLLRLEAGAWVALDRSSGLPTDQTLGFLETRDADGNPVFWIGTANGLAVIRGDRLTIEGAAQGLPGPQVLALAELKERGRPPEIWASVVGLGLVRRVGERWQRVDARPGVQRRLRRVAARLERKGRCGRPVGRHREERRRAHGARPLERADRERRPALEPRRLAARDRRRRTSQPVGGHARRRHRRDRRREGGRDVEPRHGPAERRRDVARRGAPARWSPRGVGRHQGRASCAAACRGTRRGAGSTPSRGRRCRARPCSRSARTARAASTSARSAASSA